MSECRCAPGGKSEDCPMHTNQTDPLFDLMVKDFKDEHTAKEVEQWHYFGGYTLAWVAGYAKAKGYSKLTGEALGQKLLNHILDLLQEWDEDGNKPEGGKWE